MDTLETSDRLDLDDDRLFNEEIKSKSAVNPLSLVNEGQRFLTFDREAAFGQFVGKASFVRGFEHARPELMMDIDRRTDDPFGDCIQTVLVSLHASGICKRPDNRAAVCSPHGQLMVGTTGGIPRLQF